ncbi:MAG: response regulator [Crocinitomicaceae bacterium]
MSVLQSASTNYSEEIKKMGSRKSFIVKVTLILLLLLIMVVITGTYAYRQFTGILEGVSETTRPDARLLTAEALQNDLNDAEISVKSFSLIPDSLFIDQFEKAKNRTFYRLTALHEITHEMTHSSVQLDSLDTLVRTKIKILEDLLLLRDKYRIGKVLRKVMFQVGEDVKKNNSDTSEERNILLRWLFKKDLDLQKEKLGDEISLNALENQVLQIKEEEEIIEAAIKAKEMELIIKDQQISDRIYRMLDDLRKSELKNIARENRAAIEIIDRTKRQIAIFSIAIGLLVLFMAYIFMNYVRGSRRYRKAMNKVKSEAEDLAYTKERFLANMSHEMRTPMNAISGFTEQIAQGPLNKQQREQIEMVQKSADHLLYLINEILDFSKLQANHLELELIGFNPRELITDLKELMRNSVEKKKLHVSVELDDSIPEILLGDPYRLRQILLNLISNAIKFTDEGGIQIRAEAECSDQSSCILKIEVIDTGIGMNQKQLKKVFKEFVQAESSTSRTYGGTGLGLAIVKMLVDLHRGNIKLTSEPRVGTCVELEIPYVVGAEKDLKLKDPTEQIELNISLEGLHILIVDDEVFNRRLLSNILTKYACTFKEATNGKEAIKLAGEEKFDIILMDARMPEINGIKATKIIRKENLKSSQSPIIALTAAVTEEDRDTYKEAGMDGFLAKPYQENDLLKAIEQVLSVSKDNNTSPENKRGKSKKIDPTKNHHLDFSQLKEIAQGDEPFYLNMLATFIEETENGIQRMQKSLKEKEWVQLADHAHKIASPAGHLGAKELHTLLKSIENTCREEKVPKNMKKQVEAAIQAANNAIEEAKHEIEQTKAN